MIKINYLKTALSLTFLAPKNCVTTFCKIFRVKYDLSLVQSYPTEVINRYGYA